MINKNRIDNSFIYFFLKSTYNKIHFSLKKGGLIMLNSEGLRFSYITIPIYNLFSVWIKCYFV